MAYTMAYTDVSRRQYSTGSVFQRCEARYGCPPLDADKQRPDHSCKARWFGTLEAGFTASGTRRRVTVSGTSKSVVMRRLRDKRLELERDGAANTRRTVTVAKWAQTWLEAIQPHVRPSSYETDRAAVRWITASIGHHKLADLTPETVRAVAVAIRKDGGSSSTALRYHGSLMRMLKAASREGYNLPPNVLLAEKPKAAVNNREPLTLPECLRVLAHIQRRDDDGALLLPSASRWSLAMLQGLRQGEALGLTWDEVDLNAGQMTVCWQSQSLRYLDERDPERGFRIPDGYEARHLIGSTHLVRPKSKAGWRTMPLIPWAQTTLREWNEVAPDNEHGLVWPGRTTKAGTWPRNAASDRDEWVAIQQAAKVAHPAGRPYVVHEIRHAVATLLMELKVPESVRIAIIGHSSINSTRTYERVDPDQMRLALAGVGKALELD